MKYILYIGNKLLRHGATPTSIDTLSELLQKERLPVKTASSRKNKFLRLAEMIWIICRNWRKTKAVLIDTYSTQNFWYAVACGQVCRFFKIPYYPILHGGNLPHRLKTHPKISRKFFGRAKVTISPSRYLISNFEKQGYSNLKFIPNPLQLEKYTFKKRTHFLPNLLWVRAFDEIYNPLLALKVVRQLQKAYPEISLTMVGPEKDGSLKKCKAYAEKYKLPVVFTGKLDKNEWLAKAEKKDVFLNTSNIDNMPVSVLEAMALGIPVVSTAVGGIPFMINDYKNGILVPVNNVEKMLTVVIFLLEYPEKAQQISINAFNFIQEFGWEQVKQLWLQELV